MLYVITDLFCWSHYLPLYSLFIFFILYISCAFIVVSLKPTKLPLYTKYALQIHQYIYLSVICLFSLSFGSISLLMLFHLLSFTWFLLIDFCFNLFFPYCPYAQVHLSMCISDSLILSNQSEQVLIYSRKKNHFLF